MPLCTCLILLCVWPFARIVCGGLGVHLPSLFPRLAFYLVTNLLPLGLAIVVGTQRQVLDEQFLLAAKPAWKLLQSHLPRSTGA